MEANEHIENWTAQQLSDYAQGRLPDGEAHRLERDMLDDPFLSDAVEGYSTAAVLPDMQALDKKWASRTHGNASAGQGGLLGAIFTGIAVLVVIGLVMTFFQQKEVAQLADEVVESMEANASQQEVYADSLEVLEIQLAHLIDVEKEIRPESTRAEQTAIKANDEEIEREQSNPPAAISPLDPRIQEKEVLKGIAEPTPDVFYLQDLKLADHRPHYANERYLRGEWLSGTAAIYEREQKGITQVADIEQVDYEGIMSDAMSLFVARDYKSALLVLKRVEKKHPNDANVAFYGGLCYYNLSKLSRADVYFRRAMNHASRVFDQEARWYLALSLIEQGKMDAARHHLQNVVDEKGFYAVRAKSLLAGSL